MLKNLYVEYWLVQSDGLIKTGPFTTALAANEYVIEKQLSDCELKMFLSYIPF